MILIASILGGTAIGYLTGAGRRGTRLILIVWLAVLAGQTALLLSASDDTRDRETGGWDPAYFPIALAILALGLALLHASAAIRRHRSEETMMRTRGAPWARRASLMRQRVGRGVVAAVVAAASIVLSAQPGATKTTGNHIVLPGAESAEGIALGAGATFFAGDLFAGDIFRGDLQRGAAALFIDAPDGRQAGGMAYDNSTGLLFVAGVFTGQAYVYDTKTGATVAVYDLADPDDGPVINDVALARGGAWFTNSTQPELYFVPIEGGVPGPASTLALNGPAAVISGQFNLNGIAATANGEMLVVSHSANAALYLVDPVTGASTSIEGLNLPNVDGIVLRGHRLWAVQNFSNQVSAVRLAADLGSGAVDHVITTPDFQTPTTAVLRGDRLGVVNAKFHTGFPPTASQYEVVIVAS